MAARTQARQVAASPDGGISKELERLRLADLRAGIAGHRRSVPARRLNRANAKDDGAAHNDEVFNRCRAILGNQTTFDAAQKMHNSPRGAVHSPAHRARPLTYISLRPA